MVERKRRGTTEERSQNMTQRGNSAEGGLKEGMPEIALEILSFYPPNKHILNSVNIIHLFPSPAYYLLSFLTTMASPLVDIAVR